MLQDPRKVDPSTIESDLKALTINSKTLNRLTDELAMHVERVESAVNSLNLGLTASVFAEQSSDGDGPWTHYVRLLYEKLGGKWGLVIDEFDEHDHDPDQWRNHQTWAYGDAPRELRLMAADKIPDLLKALIKRSEEMAAKTAMTVGRAKEIATTLSKPAPDSRGK
jgi:hypothetical protein